MPFEPSYTVFDDRRPFLVEGSEVGVLFLHGFMGTPKSLRPLAEAMAERGLTVHAPLLPGHGHHPDKLKGAKAPQWLEEAEEGLATIMCRCSEVVIIGHSMGAVIGSCLANRHPERVRGIVLVAPPLELPDWRLKFTPVLRYLMPWIEPLKRSGLKKIAHERIIDMYPEVNVDDPALQDWLHEISRLPTSSLEEMRKMFVRGRAEWPRLTTPALVIQGGRDIATKTEHSQAIFDQLPAQQKEILLIPEGGHQLLRDNSAAMRTVWLKMFAFVEANTSAKLSGEPVAEATP